jgi:hypothetical protein
MDNLIYTMKLHNVLHFNGFTVTRVPGGWVYTFDVCDCYGVVEDTCGVFVPFNNEFQVNQESI